MVAYHLCAGTLWEHTLEERFRAAAAGGFDELSVFPTDIVEGERERNYATITNCSDRYGVDVTVLEPYTAWAPEWREIPAEKRPPLYDFDREEFFEMGRRLDIDAMTILEPFGTELELDVAATHIGELCDRAGEQGWQVNLEFIPFTGIATLNRAWRVLERVDASNAGLVFDTWHYHHSSRDDELLAAIPGERIDQVQVSDAHAEFVEGLREDALQHRLMPGEGVIDLEGILGQLATIDGLSTVAIEVMSDQLTDDSPEEIGQTAGAALRNLVEPLS